MPTQWAHTHYWENSSTVVTPVATAPRGGYPVWQSGAVTLGFGPAELWNRIVDWLTWTARMIARTYRYDRQRRAIIGRTLDALEHPAFPLAQAAVKKTATTLGFNRPEAWKELSRELKGSAGHAENAFRHLEACRLVRANLLNSTVTNPECHLIVELAYHGFASRVK